MAAPFCWAPPTGRAGWSIDYLFGLARDPRLAAALEAEQAATCSEAGAKRRPARRYRDFLWSTRDSWSRQRRACPGQSALARRSGLLPLGYSVSLEAFGPIRPVVVPRPTGEQRRL